MLVEALNQCLTAVVKRLRVNKPKRNLGKMGVMLAGKAELLKDIVLTIARASLV